KLFFYQTKIHFRYKTLLLILHNYYTMIQIHFHSGKYPTLHNTQIQPCITEFCTSKATATTDLNKNTTI
ncbi:MAG: hypothetical protein ACRCX5_09510, partial [Bacteroidales bacterium]